MTKRGLRERASTYAHRSGEYETWDGTRNQWGPSLEAQKKIEGYIAGYRACQRDRRRK